MDRDTRGLIESATQRARRLLEEDFAAQLEGDFDVLLDGRNLRTGGEQLGPAGRRQRERIVATIEHKQAIGLATSDAVVDYLRDASFTTLNRFVALKMLEVRGLVQQCVSKGESSSGYSEFTMLAKGLQTLPDGYRIYLESIFDELSTEVKVLFDRRDPASVVWPRRPALVQLLEILNDSQLAAVWAEDETIGWVYQYFNSGEERQAMRKQSQAPRNSRELAVRNQFFTPRYVVQFLTDNTLGRIWYEMRGGDTGLKDRCEYLIRRPGESLSLRPKKDPRDIRVLDPACGSGHFLLYAFGLLTAIYEEAHTDPDSPPSEATGRTLAQDYPDRGSIRGAVPELILTMNLYGVDIDPRCAQIAQLALWLRAQRAYHDAGIRRDGRPRIRRTNVVIAEPLVANATVATEFEETLSSEDLRNAFRELVSALAFAGELGLLLRVETLRGEPLKHGYAADLFAPAEESLHEALERYSAARAMDVNMRRRLFADDSAQGLGLLKLAAQKYDVVLMNPPFGDATPRVRRTLEQTYPRSKNDIFAVFVERGIGLLESQGLLGAITSRTGFFLPTFQRWREEVLLNEAPPVTIADLGLGVMDAALVEAAAYCLERDGKHDTSVIVRTLEDRDKKRSLEEAIEGQARDTRARYFEVKLSSLRSIPRSPFSYWVSDNVRSLFRTLPLFESEKRTARVGLQSSDDFRFLRLWWEVEPERVNHDWFLFAKGGSFSPFFADLHLVVNWRYGGREIVNLRKEGSDRPASRPQNVEYFWRPGLTWPHRTKSELGFRVLPRGCIFGHKGPAAFVVGDDGEILLAYLAVFRSAAFRGLVDLQLAAAEPTGRGGVARSYDVGVIQRTPVPHLSQQHVKQLAELARRGWAAQRARDIHDETSHAFILPAEVYSSGISVEPSRELAVVQQNIDEYLFGLFGISGTDRRAIESTSDLQRPGLPAPREGGQDDDDESDDGSFRGGESDALLSWLVGVAFGRFDVRLATGQRPLPAEPGPFDPLPVRSAGMWPAEDKTPIPVRDILVDDPGHPHDLAQQVTANAEVVNVAVPEPADLRKWLARTFFPLHVRMYSKSRRKAPIYWHLATRSGSYSVWIYIHSMTADTMFRIQDEYVVPKLRLEEQRLEHARTEAGESATVARRKAIAENEALIDDLRGFLDEVRRVAPLWNPNLDDGVVLNFAPLWRLVPHHKSWQRELKTVWDALREGKYDWTNLAMHLWPERVVPKCARDLSIAMAHGLEDIFWEQGRDGRWGARKHPTCSINELVSERTSTAVKAALDDLLNGPATTGQGAGRRAVGNARGGR